MKIIIRALVVLLNDKLGGEKKMYVGKHFAGEKFRDLFSNFEEKVVIDENGFGKFRLKTEAYLFGY